MVYPIRCSYCCQERERGREEKTNNIAYHFFVAAAAEVVAMLGCVFVWVSVIRFFSSYISICWQWYAFPLVSFFIRTNAMEYT